MDSQFQDSCTNFRPQFSKDELLPPLTTSNYLHPRFSNLLHFLFAHSNHITFDNHSIDQRLELPFSARPYAKRQVPSLDTTSEISLLTIPSPSNVLVSTHRIGNPPPNLDPPHPLSSQHPINAQPSTSLSPRQYNTPSNTIPPTNPITT